MVDSPDWRLTGQEKYLRGVELCRRMYRPYPMNPTWEHDHCEFCGMKFAVEDQPDILHEGYCTLNEYRWIFTACFDDFREMFGWRIVTAPVESL